MRASLLALAKSTYYLAQGEGESRDTRLCAFQKGMEKCVNPWQD